MAGSYFDVVVLGAGLPPLCCGALLAKRGFRVLVLGQDHLRASYRVGEYSLSLAPFAFLPTQSPVARRVMAELALGQTFRRLAATMDPTLQVAERDHRIDLALDDAELDREVEREFPEVKRAVEDFHRRVDRANHSFDALVERDLVWPPETFLERREFARAAAHQPFDRDGEGLDLLGEFPDEHPFRTVVHAPARFADGMDPDQTTALRIARHYGAWRRGAAVLEGGYDALEQMLTDRIVTHSGEVRYDDRADRILMKRNQARGVRIAASGEEIGCGFVVAGVGLAAMLRLLPDRRPYEEVFERLGEPQLRHFRYTLNVVMAAEGVPMGMARDVFFLRDARRPPAAENLLHVQVAPADAEGRRTLSVEALVPRRGVEDVAGYVETLRERVLGSLGELVPFLGKHVLLVDSPHDGRDPQDMLTGEPVQPEETFRRGRHTMTPIYGYPVATALGSCALPVRTPFKRLLLVNHQVAPGLGTEGDLLAAWSGARIVTKSDRKKEHMRRGLWTKAEI